MIFDQFNLFPVHPEADEVEGDRCYPSLGDLPESVDGLFVCISPNRTEQVVREAAAAGIKRVWLQQGAASGEAIAYCREQGMEVVHGECILMFAEPAGLGHRMHRGLWRLLGKLPD